MFAIKKGSMYPILEATLQDEKKNPIDLSTAASVTFRWRLQTGTKTLSGVCTIVDMALGKVEYHWNALDTKTPGDYYGEFVIRFNSNDVLVTPSGSFTEFTIEASL